MKQLSESDINKMLGAEYIPDAHAVNRGVRRDLKLSRLIPPTVPPVPKIITLDLHEKTVDIAWDEINRGIFSGARKIIVITGASGILKVKFTEWIKYSTIAKYIINCAVVNNGCFEIQIKKNITSLI